MANHHPEPPTLGGGEGISTRLKGIIPKKMHLPQKCPLSFQHHANVVNEETKWPAKNSIVRHRASQFLRPMANVANEQHLSPNIKVEVVRETGFHRREWILRGGKDRGNMVDVIVKNRLCWELQKNNPCFVGIFVQAECKQALLDLLRRSQKSAQLTE